MHDPRDLVTSVLRKQRESAETTQRLVEAAAPRIGACATAMAARFADGGRLHAFGNGGSACDAQHVAVEFLHPVLEKRESLPAHALSADAVLLTAIGNDQDFSMVFSSQLRQLGRATDIALGISTSGRASNVLRGLQAARELGMLTVGFTGRDGGRMPQLCDHCFVVESFSIHRIQEAHGFLLHVLWDLVHVARGHADVL
jgi:D-sedoheptulose 7-phosphate isomerase